MERLFAVCAPGLEPFTAQELEALNLTRGPSPSGGQAYEPGGVEFQGTLQDVYRANLHLRSASRVLVRLGDFHAAAFSELRKKAGRLAWENYLSPGRPVALRVSCHRSRLYHEGAVAERLVGAIADRLAGPLAVERYREDADADPGPPHRSPQLIVARLVDNLCTISIDSSGALLHRRGYRLATAKAPLRETLAAGMLIASGWDRASPLLDPFCGSGTVPIEAALMAGGVPPGLSRRFSFMDWPNFDPGIWEGLLAGARKSVFPARARPLTILASDRDTGAVQAARENAKRAGVGDAIEFSCRAVSAVEPPPGPGWVVTDPPYGVRLGRTKDLRNLYAQLGNVLRSRCPGWSVTLISDSLPLIRSTGLGFDQGIPILHGGLRVRLVRCVIPRI